MSLRASVPRPVHPSRLVARARLARGVAPLAVASRAVTSRAVTPLAIASLAAASLAACRGNPHPAALPPLASGDDAVLVAPGIVSTGDVFSSALSADGRTLWFTRGDLARTRLQVMVTRRVGDGAAARWTPAVPAPFATVARTMDPHLAPDGRTLWFNMPRDPAARRGEPAEDWDTWTVPLDAGGAVAGAPRRVEGGPSTDSWEGFASVAADGTVYWGLWPQATAGADTVRRGIWRQARGGAPERLPAPINVDGGPSVGSASNPYVTADGRVLVFMADRAGGQGRGDLWVATRAPDGGWTVPVNLGPRVNTPDIEFAPQLTRDGTTLLFSRVEFAGEQRVRENVWAIPVRAVPALRAALDAAGRTTAAR